MQENIDLLSRNTTWNLSRDTSGGLEFPPTNFYDGQSILVSEDSGIDNLDDLNSKSICVIAGTTSESNLAEQMHSYSISYTPMLFEDLARLSSSDASHCWDAFTSDIFKLVTPSSTQVTPSTQSFKFSYFQRIFRPCNC